MFPPKHKFLTTREYKEEGVEEFCRQNTGEMYKLMAKLQSPNR